jgi:hypothetical protein
MITRPGKLISIMRGEPVTGAAPNFVTCPPVTYVNLAADPDWTEEREVGLGTMEKSTQR